MALTATVHEVDGEFTVNVPENVAREYGLREGLALDVNIVNNKLVLKPRRSKYTVEELLAQCDFSLPMSEEDKEWDAMRPVGRELI